MSKSILIISEESDDSANLVTLQAVQVLGYMLSVFTYNQKYLKAQAPTTGIAKLDTSSSVIIKVDAYPFKEYGAIHTTLHHMSLVPYTDDQGQAYYEIGIPLTDTLITHYQKILPYRPDMNATIEMITEDKSILKRILHQFLDLVKN